MLSIILYRPQIPPNTGNIIRLCANGAAELHLVGPIGFSLDEKAYRRAGLDYHALAVPKIHADWAACMKALGGKRIWAITKFGTKRYDRAGFGADDCLLFGSETDGLPQEIHDALPEANKLYIPMAASNRSLNLSNAAALVLYEAWRQQDFIGGVTYDSQI